MKFIARFAAAAALSVSLAACGGSKDEAATSGDQAATPSAEQVAVATEAASEAASAAVTASNAADAATQAASAAGAPAAAPAAFGICKTCHAVEKGKNGIGPSLYAITGTKAGDVAGYNFSPALKASGLVWDDATLDKWLENPMKIVPGTKMTYAGQADPAKRKEIIEYLKTLK